MTKRKGRATVRGGDRQQMLFDAAEGHVLLDDIFKLLKPEGWAGWLKIPLKRAAAEGKRALAQKLVGKGAEIGDALHAAVRGGHAEIVSDLLKSGASLGAKDGNGHTALHVAAQYGHVKILRAAIKHGADVEAADRSESTPLHVATLYKRVEAINVLLDAGANIEARGSNECTPLQYAAVKTNVEALLVLLKRAARVNFVNAYDNTALMIAAANAGTRGAAEAADSLLRAGADETLINEDGRSAADLIAEDVEEEDRLVEDVERMRDLLANAPADRAWRRRGYLALCHAHPDRIQQSKPLISGRAAGIGERREMDGSIVGDWTVVMAKVLRLEEEDMFRAIVGYL
eukprot:g20864.t1